jgi:hypothetical protein
MNGCKDAWSEQIDTGSTYRTAEEKMERLNREAKRPVRIQRKRTKGWKMPPNTIYVGRPSEWANHFRVGLVPCSCRSAGDCSHNTFNRATAQEAVADYRAIPRSEKRIARIRAILNGKNLACWCPLDQPCHADVLLEIANPASGIEE